MRPSTRSTGGIIPQPAGCLGPKQPDRDRWAQSLAAHYTVVAVAGGTVAGFADLASDGYFDRLFVHKDFQRQDRHRFGRLDRRQARELPSLRSAPRLPSPPGPFEKRGYRVVQEQRKPHNGQVFVNFVMESAWENPICIKTGNRPKAGSRFLSTVFG